MSHYKDPYEPIRISQCHKLNVAQLSFNCHEFLMARMTQTPCLFWYDMSVIWWLKTEKKVPNQTTKWCSLVNTDPRHPGPPKLRRYFYPKNIPKTPNLRRYDWMSRVNSLNPAKWSQLNLAKPTFSPKMMDHFFPYIAPGESSLQVTECGARRLKGICFLRNWIWVNEDWNTAHSRFLSDTVEKTAIRLTSW